MGAFFLHIPTLPSDIPNRPKKFHRNRAFATAFCIAKTTAPNASAQPFVHDALLHCKDNRPKKFQRNRAFTTAFCIAKTTAPKTSAQPSIRHCLLHSKDNRPKKFQRNRAFTTAYNLNAKYQSPHLIRLHYKKMCGN